MNGGNVWALLLSGHEDQIDRADTLVAAAIGADENPEIFTELLRETLDAIVTGSDAATKVLEFIAAQAGVTRGILGNMAELVHEAVEETGERDEGSVEDPRRAYELNFLREGVDALKRTVSGDTGEA
jgi:hypothetical protein